MTATHVALFACGIDNLAQRRWLLGVLFTFLGGVQVYSLWNRFWRISADGTLCSQGYGTRLTYALSDLRYAGPVRGEYSFPFSRKNGIELELAGIPAKRYAQVADRPAFLQQLQHAAPNAHITQP